MEEEDREEECLRMSLGRRRNEERRRDVERKCVVIRSEYCG